MNLTIYEFLERTLPMILILIFVILILIGWNQ